MTTLLKELQNKGVGIRQGHAKILNPTFKTPFPLMLLRQNSLFVLWKKVEIS